MRNWFNWTQVVNKDCIISPDCSSDTTLPVECGTSAEIWPTMQQGWTSCSSYRLPSWLWTMPMSIIRNQKQRYVLLSADRSTEIRSEVLLTPALLCHKDTVKRQKCFGALSCVFMASATPWLQPMTVQPGHIWTNESTDWTDLDQWQHSLDRSEPMRVEQPGLFVPTWSVGVTCSLDSLCSLNWVLDSYCLIWGGRRETPSFLSQLSTSNWLSSSRLGTPSGACLSSDDDDTSGHGLADHWGMISWMFHC